jgi:hypothetical protein
MEMNGWLHALAASPSGKQTPQYIPTARSLSGITTLKKDRIFIQKSQLLWRASLKKHKLHLQKISIDVSKWY